MNHLTIPAIQQIIANSANSPDPMPVDHWKGLGNEAPYYKFLYFLTQAVQPDLVVELGMLHGKGTAYLAAGAPEAHVIGIDWHLPTIQPPYPNIEWWQGDTIALGEVFALSIDVLFIDSTHQAEHATKEFNLYWPMMKPGAILLADDIYLGDMRNFWDIIPEPKFIDPTLHGNLGFGIAVK